MESAMRANLWNKSAPRVEIDQRVRDARLRLHRIERLLVPQSPLRGSSASFVFVAQARPLSL
jgi:hypothetical protein